ASRPPWPGVTPCLTRLWGWPCGCRIGAQRSGRSFTFCAPQGQDRLRHTIAAGQSLLRFFEGFSRMCRKSGLFSRTGIRFALALVAVATVAAVGDGLSPGFYGARLVPMDGAA